MRAFIIDKNHAKKIMPMHQPKTGAKALATFKKLALGLVKPSPITVKHGMYRTRNIAQSINTKINHATTLSLRRRLSD